MTTYKTLNIENKTIKGHNVVIKSIEKTIDTRCGNPLIVNFFECLLNGKNIGSHEVGQKQLDWMLNENNIDKYSII